MTDGMKPALTPEEWAHLEMASGKRDTLFAYVSSANRAEDESPSARTGPLKIGWNGDMCKPVAQDGRHALAALALHGQPFGFTREDAKELRMLADDGIFELYNDPDTAPFLRSLADRIAALLPPEPAHAP